MSEPQGPPQREGHPAGSLDSRARVALTTNVQDLTKKSQDKKKEVWSSYVLRLAHSSGSVRFCYLQLAPLINSIIFNVHFTLGKKFIGAVMKIK